MGPMQNMPLSPKPVKSAKPVKSPQETTVVVAMSGGVDSSLAAALLVELT